VSIGVLGGTFNPPHLGHLQIARCALEQLQLERVLLMPARLNPLKPAEHDPGPEHRLQMCELLCAGEDGLETCAAELCREGPSYTVETLRELHGSHPDVGWTFIAGADAAATLPRWHAPAELLGLARLAVAGRGQDTRERVLAAVAEVSTQDGRATAISGEDGRPGPEVSFLEMPPMEVSSSQVRERLGRGEPVAELVGEPVARYIDEQRLYRGPA
jgi:nicotinate-nucleotide adenylyltransferase